jgi:DNA-binding transcriptional ArsR family regulator
VLAVTAEGQSAASQADQDGTQAVLSALADPTRRALLRRLAGGPMSAGELAQGFEISRPAIARHLRLLLLAELVQVQKAGRRQVYSLVPASAELLEDVFGELISFWHAGPTAPLKPALDPAVLFGDYPPATARFFEWVRASAAERAVSMGLIRRLSSTSRSA